MTTWRAFAFGLLMISPVSCVGTTDDRETPGQIPEAVARFERTLAEQDRVNRYLHQAVVPGMVDCWRRLEGRGGVAVEIEYRRDGGNWVPDGTELRDSTLPAGQEVPALACITAAVDETSFAVTPEDRETRVFSVNWSFPVPWPEDNDAVLARMIDTGGGGGGCGGPESPPPACWDCFYIPFVRISYCGKTCAGYKECRPIPSGCQMGPIEPKCVTASPFGNQGGLVLY